VPSLTTLDPAFRPYAEAFFQRARVAAQGGLVVTSARRTRQEQQYLYNEYLAGRNNGLPAVPPGSSDHELGLAWDMARLNVDPLDDALLTQFGREWQALGGRWWAGDPVHFAAPRAWLTYVARRR
jgi:LAS superfamily LD-carboxypeptidase LdcB